MSTTLNGKTVIWGVPEKIAKVVTDIPGRIRLRFRNKAFAQVFIQSPDGIRKFFLTDNRDGTWSPTLEQGRNHRMEGSSQ